MTEFPNQNDRTYLDCQNRFRGLIAQFRSHRYEKGITSRPVREFRTGFSNLLLDARAALQPSQYRPFIEWLQDTYANQVSEVHRQPVGYDDLGGIYGRAPIVGLEEELAWLAERFRSANKQISAFLLARHLIELAVLSGKYDDAIEGIETLQELLGVTLWSVQLRLALEQVIGGLERQKQYSADVRGVYKRGLLGFVAYHTSVRNEERSTISRFLEDIENRIANHRYFDPGTKTYARYRLKAEFPENEAGLADILRIEQSHGLLDAYETYVSVLQELVGRNPDEALSQKIVESIESSAVDDFRLSKLVKLLEPSTDLSLAQRDTASSDALFSGLTQKSALLSLRTLRHPKIGDPWQLVYAGFALAHGTRPRGPCQSEPVQIVHMIARVQSRCDHSAEAWAQASKLSLNFRGLPTFAGVHQFLRQIKRAEPDAQWRPWLIGLNSPTVGVEDDNWNGPAPINGSGQTNATARAWLHVFRTEPADTSAPASALAAAAGYVQGGEYDEAISLLNCLDSALPKPLDALCSLLKLHAHYRAGNRSEVIRLIADVGSISAAHREFLPIEGSLAAYRWEDFAVGSDDFASPIALNLLWREREQSATASQMRFATGRTLTRVGVAKPSELVTHSRQPSDHQLVYFLRNVCVPEVLDITRMFESSRDVLEERASICRHLRELDEGRSDEYDEEISQISRTLALEEGQWIVDRSRIHVDRDALIRWALRELAEDFSRYRDLAGVNVEIPESFDDVLRELEKVVAQPTTFSPDNEADAVLMSILRRFGEEFLTNATHGLDFHLSKRVRHQSFIGLIRGPLEFARLITTRETATSDYRRNDEWVDRFVSASDHARDQIDSSLRRFAEQFDETLVAAKDNYFHIRSDDHPQGMVVLPLSGSTVRFCRALLRYDLTLVEFFDIAVTVLWSALEPSLINVRDFISNKLKEDLIANFDEIRAEVRRLAGQDLAFLDFDAAMGEASRDVQLKLDEAAQWFVHSGTAALQRSFSLDDTLEIAVDTALRSFRDFSPDIDRTVIGDVRLHATNLVRVVDVLLDGLGNAKKHSGLKEPRIDISVVGNEEHSEVTVAMTSDCKSSNRKSKAERSDEIRDMIAKGEFSPRTRKEGGSGFAKLAAMVEGSERGSLDFGFNDDDRFELTVTIPIWAPQTMGAEM